MSTLEITLPEKLRNFVDSEAAAGGHASANDYVVALLAEAQKKQAWAKAEQLVLEGMKSPKRPMTAEDWQEIRDHIHSTPSSDKSKS